MESGNLDESLDLTLTNAIICQLSTLSAIN